MGGEPLRYLDFVVDGESLGNDYYRAYGVGVLGNGPADWEEANARRLLLDEPPEVDNRVALYVDPSEGDIEGGAVTVIIRQEGDEIVWREAAWSYFDANEGPSYVLHNCEAYQQWPAELRFDAAEYRRVIEERPRLD
jgi:hypothetical protein